MADNNKIWQALANKRILLVESLQLHYNAVTSAKDFKCGNSMISDEWRNEILSLVNDYRRKVSKGEQEGSTAPLPTAKQMNELTWDCNIEAAAQKAAASCPSRPSPVPKYTGNQQANEIGYLKMTAPTAGDVYIKNDDAATYCGEPTCDCVNGLCKNTVEPALFTSTICGTGTKACAGAFSDQFRDIARNMSNYYR
ncbi:SCP-like protein [Necator americanus]|uniref:SCP-like protein n=1 Tax=Necator americanus TaxID=51031 RepID=W2TMX7_NECAM|nr:SCP-like protein [Necator americanus]ETN83128.1 SCP-like protein [Necator americanus]